MGSRKDKPLYVIGVVSEMLDLHPQTLRMYEREDFIHPSRTDGKTRRYSDNDVDRLKYVIHLTKDLGINRAGVKEILKMRSEIENLKNLLSKSLGGASLEGADFKKSRVDVKGRDVDVKGRDVDEEDVKLKIIDVSVVKEE